MPMCSWGYDASFDGRFMMSSLLLTLSAAAAASSLLYSTSSATGRWAACQQSPTQDLLPQVVGPMVGMRPVWLVDGSTTWRSGEPVKTLWVLLRTSEEVRIGGRRLDGPGTLTLRQGDDRPADMLVITNPAKQSVTPGNAPPKVMHGYVFLPSHVFYPSPGCWEFAVRIGPEEVRIVRDLKPQARFEVR
jgi:hypothetical protein